MKLFLTSAAGLAFGLAFASAASAACLSGNCPPVAGTALTYTNPPTSNLPQPRNWQSMIQFNAGWAAETNGLASGIGDNVEALSAITEQYTVNSLGSVMVDPNCGPQCGEQTLTSDWDLMQTVDNRVIARSAGHGTADNPVFARSGSMSMGSFEGFMGAMMMVGEPPITTIPLPEGN